MEKEKEREKLDKALLKVALGFQVAEVTEEFAEVDGELKLTKRKRVKKDVPPDLKAVQLLLGESGSVGVESWTDEELEREKSRLLGVLESVEKNGEGAGQVCDENKKSVKKATKTAAGKTEKTTPTKKRATPRKRVVRKKKEN